MNGHEARVKTLREAREQGLRKLGKPCDKVIGRNLAAYLQKHEDPTRFLWPSSTTGTIRLVLRENSVLFITDGISDPWDTSLHSNAPPGTFDYELAIEVPNTAFPSLSEDALFNSWAPKVLIAATDWMIAERHDLVGVITKFDCATIAVPPVEGTKTYVFRDGYMRGLVGIPIAGELGMGYCLAMNGELPVFLLTLKLLTADEVEYAMQDNSGKALDLIARFIQRGDRHLTWVNRSSVLKEPALK